MENKYFGIIDENNLRNLNYEELEKYLIKKQLLQPVHSISITPEKTNDIGQLRAAFEISPKNFSNIYYQEITNEVIQFLLSHYKAGIGGNKAIFNRDFDDETFGLSKLEKKKVALDYFNKYFNLAKGITEVGLRYNSEMETVAEKRFQTLKRINNSFYCDIQNFDNNLVLAYLIGLKDYFDRELFETDPFILEMFQFENNLSILIRINNEFKFEEEDVFTAKNKAKIIFEEYNDKFQSLKQVEFIEQKLKNIANQNHSFVVSLFFFFKKEIKIKTPSAKIFQEIINNNFKHNFGEIKLSDPQNSEHKKRLKKLHLEWH